MEKAQEKTYTRRAVSSKYPFCDFEYASTMFGNINRIASLYQWVPQKDITVYELSLCIPVFSTQKSATTTIERLPECARRHFYKDGDV